MKEELNSLAKNDSWERVNSDEFKGKNLITLLWVYKIKKDSDGNINRFKSRLVARGFTQRYGYDFLNTSSPVISVTSIQHTFKLLMHQPDFSRKCYR